MHYRNKRPLPIYNKPNEQIVRTNVPTADNIQMKSTGSRGLDGPIDDEVIYSKPSFENNSSSQTRNYELSDRRPKSFQSATSSTSKPDDNCISSSLLRILVLSLPSIGMLAQCVPSKQ